MEKVHGTSAHISYKGDLENEKNDLLHFFSGGEKHDRFIELFNIEELKKKFREIGHPEVTVFGEAYGGKQQRMSKTYGPNLKFVSFEVKIGNHWLNVEKANNVTDKLGLEFVHWVKGPATREFADKWRDAPSEQAIRNGMGNEHIREGIVIRPPIEVITNDGSRMAAKHKRDEFRETRTPNKDIDPEKKEKLAKAKEVANEYVVPMRLEHVLDKLKAEKLQENPEFEFGMELTGQVIKRMIEDIKIEEGDEIEWSDNVSKAIGRKTAALFKIRLTNEELYQQHMV